MQNDDIRILLILIGTLILSTILIPDMPFFNISNDWAISLRVFGFAFGEIMMISAMMDYIENDVEEEY